MDLDKAIRERHSVRKFKDKKPDWRNIIEAIEAARYAPMAGNNYTVRFIVVDKPEIIQQIAEASQQPWISQVHYVVVACSILSRVTNEFGERAKIYTRQQAGAAIENFLLKLEERGLATCWVGHFVEDEIKRELKIPDDAVVEALFPIGYEFKKPLTRRTKADIDSILYFNKWKEKRMKPLEKVEA